MVQLYRVYRAVIHFACAVMGAALGHGPWGVGGAIVGAVVGGVIASGVAIFVNTPERTEAAIYIMLALLVLTLPVWSIITIWSVRI